MRYYKNENVAHDLDLLLNYINQYVYDKLGDNDEDNNQEIRSMDDELTQARDRINMIALGEAKIICITEFKPVTLIPKRYCAGIIEPDHFTTTENSELKISQQHVGGGSLKLELKNLPNGFIAVDLIFERIDKSPEIQKIRLHLDDNNNNVVIDPGVMELTRVKLIPRNLENDDS